jgi:hypothetical protein
MRLAYFSPAGPGTLRVRTPSRRMRRGRIRPLWSSNRRVDASKERAAFHEVTTFVQAIITELRVQVPDDVAHVSAVLPKDRDHGSRTRPAQETAAWPPARAQGEPAAGCARPVRARWRPANGSPARGGGKGMDTVRAGGVDWRNSCTGSGPFGRRLLQGSGSRGSQPRSLYNWRRRSGPKIASTPSPGVSRHRRSVSTLGTPSWASRPSSTPAPGSTRPRFSNCCHRRSDQNILWTRSLLPDTVQGRQG